MNIQVKLILDFEDIKILFSREEVWVLRGKKEEGRGFPTFEDLLPCIQPMLLS